MITAFVFVCIEKNKKHLNMYMKINQGQNLKSSVLFCTKELDQNNEMNHICFLKGFIIVVFFYFKKSIRAKQGLLPRSRVQVFPWNSCWVSGAALTSIHSFSVLSLKLQLSE